MSEGQKPSRGRPRKHPQKMPSIRGRGRPAVPFMENPHRFGVAIAFWLIQIESLKGRSISEESAILEASLITGPDGNLKWEPRVEMGRTIVLRRSGRSRQMADRKFNTAGHVFARDAQAKSIRRAWNRAKEDPQAWMWVNLSTAVLLLLSPDGGNSAHIAMLVGLGWSKILPRIIKALNGLQPLP